MTSTSLTAHAGSLMVLYGATTGRDGIGGVSVLASATLDEGSQASRPSVQIGDPFAEKLLIEASLRADPRRVCWRACRTWGAPASRAR